MLGRIGGGRTSFWIVAAVAGILALLVPGSARAEVEHYLGVGAQYWRTIDEIDLDEIDDDGFSWLVSYQLSPAPLFRIQVDVEMLPDNFRGAEDTVLAPQLYAVVGSGIYGAVGGGYYYTDGDFSSDPFFVLRVGVNAELFPHVYIDVNGNYRFQDWDELDLEEDIDTDTVMIGAALRFKL